uniref:Hydroxyproline O-arabinosyltransferase-like domain-containing protein n=1 Tax=Chlamydomonas euryale TaxID=1486919 RepID=A0A7R9VVW4_9CHLO|mmetsp:Transcript_45266/g.135090  ORF Transcript_45266/g.135090 Transcript_45266/m.135090 type:complete len:532 (+) Transcript_45266:83-1678(+)
MKMNTERLALVSMAAVALVTFYSFSELHRMSTENISHRDIVAGFQDSGDEVSTSQSRVRVADEGQAAPKVARPQQASISPELKCYAYPNTELWGEVLGSASITDSQEACCIRCQQYTPPNEHEPGCNVWMYCGDKSSCGLNYGECILKHLGHPEAVAPAKRGSDVAWTAGTLGVNIDGADADTNVVRKFHIVTTAQGSAVHWQVRIHYYWYKKQKWQCEQDLGVDKCEMGGFTRLLHSGEPDDLMDEIPTMVVKPLPADMVENNWYVVLNRPYAFVQWVKQQNIPEKYVLMAEPDHVYIRPLKNFMTSESPAAFPFFYIEPAKKEYQDITMKFTGQVSRTELEQIAPIGNSPTFMTLEDMKTVMPLWMNISIAIFKDPDASKAWGWVQEMYGFAIGLFLGGIRHVDLYLHMMSQPPWDMNLEQSPGKPFYIIHYTYGMDYTLNGDFTPGKYGEWRFDKRTYAGQPIPRALGDPPKGMKNDLVRMLINSFNEATDATPCWDEYHATGKIPQACDEAPRGFLAEEASRKAAGP